MCWISAHDELLNQLLDKLKTLEIRLGRIEARNWWIDTTLTVLTGIISVAISTETFVPLNPRAHALLGGFGGLLITSLLIINRTYTFAATQKEANRDRVKCLSIIGLIVLQSSLHIKDRQNASSFIKNVINLSIEVGISAPSPTLNTLV